MSSRMHLLEEGVGSFYEMAISHSKASNLFKNVSVMPSTYSI